MSNSTASPKPPSDASPLYDNSLNARLLRWMYRGGHPNAVARLMNRVGAGMSKLGFTPYMMYALEVVGRKSGKPITFPVVVCVFNGERYLVSMLGNEAQWVLNLRAAGGKAVLRGGSSESVFLTEVPVEQRAPILKAYLQRAPGARPHIPIDIHAPLADFEKIAPDYPVYRVEPRT